MVYPFFSIMALHGGGHLELKKMHKGDFWGIFGIRLGRCPCIIPEKISFLQFYSRFNPNALALIEYIISQVGERGAYHYNMQYIVHYLPSNISIHIYWNDWKIFSLVEFAECDYDTSAYQQPLLL